MQIFIHLFFFGLFTGIPTHWFHLTNNQWMIYSMKIKLNSAAAAVNDDDRQTNKQKKNTTKECIKCFFFYCSITFIRIVYVHFNGVVSCHCGFCAFQLICINICVCVCATPRYHFCYCCYCGSLFSHFSFFYLIII